MVWCLVVVAELRPEVFPAAGGFHQVVVVAVDDGVGGEFDVVAVDFEPGEVRVAVFVGVSKALAEDADGQVVLLVQCGDEFSELNGVDVTGVGVELEGDVFVAEGAGDVSVVRCASVLVHCGSAHPAVCGFEPAGEALVCGESFGVDGVGECGGHFVLLGYLGVYVNVTVWRVNP